MKSGSKKPRIVLDTKPLIKLFVKEDGWEEVQKILEYVEAGEVEAALSVITLTEIYYKYLREGRADLARKRVEALRSAFYMEKLVVNEEVAVKAGEFKGKYDISIADALIAAAAYFDGSAIISDDLDYKKIAEVENLGEKEFLSNL